MELISTAQVPVLSLLTARECHSTAGRGHSSHDYEASASSQEPLEEDSEDELDHGGE